MAIQLEYPEEYIEACFGAWYKAGAPGLLGSGNQLTIGAVTVMNSIPKHNGHKPTVQTIMKWSRKYAWRQRADVLDAQVSLKFETDLVNNRVKTLKRLAQGAETLLEKGLEYFANNPNPFSDNPSAAVRAVISASELINKFSGAGDKLTAIQQMSDRQLERELYKMLGASTNEDDETLDATLEDVPDDDDDNPGSE